jgi:hypothetical protein
MLRCAYCGSVAEVAAERPPDDRALHDGLRQDRFGFGADHARTAACGDCGASVVFHETLVAATCAFCGGSHILAESARRKPLRPESLIPFSVDKKAAHTAFKRWIRRLWLRPSRLKDLARVDALVGVYVPFWCFSAHVDSSWAAEAGHHYYTDEMHITLEGHQRKRRTRNTRWSRASGRRSDDYRDVLVCASHGLPRELADNLRTFNIASRVAYSPAYLAGWAAEEYGVALENGFSHAQVRMEAEQRHRCSADVPGDTHRGLAVVNAFSQLRFAHLLLPIFVAAYRFDGRIYRFIVNGQTGEIRGKAPWSIWKVALAIFVALTVAAIVYYLVRKS